jgi:hypothetical protein
MSFNDSNLSVYKLLTSTVSTMKWGKIQYMIRIIEIVPWAYHPPSAMDEACNDINPDPSGLDSPCQKNTSRWEAMAKCSRQAWYKVMPAKHCFFHLFHLITVHLCCNYIWTIHLFFASMTVKDVFNDHTMGYKLWKCVVQFILMGRESVLPNVKTV